MKPETSTKLLTKDKTTSPIAGVIVDDYFQEDYFQSAYFQTGALTLSGTTNTATVSLNLNRTTLKLI